MAATNCARWRRKSVPVGLREKGRIALESCVAARIETCGAGRSVAQCAWRHNSSELMQPFSHNQTGKLLRRHLAQFVAAIDNK